MTLQTATTRADYDGNGVTVAFTVPFYFLDNSHIKVLATIVQTGVTTVLTLGTDYTVSGATSPVGGTVTIAVAPLVGTKISILRNVPLTQLMHYVPNDPFPAASHEQALDQLTMTAQQLSEKINRAMTFSDATSGVSATVPTPLPLTLIGFDDTGTAVTLYSINDILTIAGSSGFAIQEFTGDGIATDYTLASIPGSVYNVEIFIRGVRQKPLLDYTVSNAVITFAVAPVNNADIFVRWGTTLGVGIVSDGSVSTNKITDTAVTTAKLANQAVSTAKLADQSVTLAKINPAVYGQTGANKLLQLDANGQLFDPLPPKAKAAIALANYYYAR